MQAGVGNDAIPRGGQLDEERNAAIYRKFCGLPFEAHAQKAPARRPVMVRGKRIKTIDVHSHCYFQQALDIAGVDGRPVFVDIDVDVCDRSVAPGCPSSAPGGLSADELRQMAFAFGRDSRVRAIDITPLKSKIKFATGTGISAAKGKLGMSLQTPRAPVAAYGDPIVDSDPIYQDQSDIVYGAAYHAAEFLIARYGEDRVNAVLANMGRGMRFPAAFREAIGIGDAEFAADFRRYVVWQGWRR